MQDSSPSEEAIAATATVEFYSLQWVVSRAHDIVAIYKTPHFAAETVAKDSSYASKHLAALELQTEFIVHFIEHAFP